MIAYEFTANRSGSESLAASSGNQKHGHWWLRPITLRIP